MISIKNHIAHFLKENAIDGHGLLVACSGGVDSMVLLHLLLELGYRPEVAHCNFGLRGAESDGDESFVKEFCTSGGLKIHTRMFGTADEAARQKISIQMAARELRYAFFEEMLKARNLKFIATAHHADDSLETILLNLGRGTGIAGLGGIRPVSGKVVRPMHQITREEILGYAHKNNIKWREDASNQKLDYQRNYLRHSVVPRLREAFPAFDGSFGKSLQHLHDDRKWFEELAGKALDQLLLKEGATEKLDISRLKESQSPKAVLRHWLLPKAFFDLAAIHSSLESESGAVFEAGGWRLLKDRGCLILTKEQAQADAGFLINETDESIENPFPMKMVKKAAGEFSWDPAKSTASLDFEKLQFPLTLRHWQEGDSFQPLGMKGSKKLSDYFIDRKYSRFDKEQAWLLCSGHRIIWIVNDRIDERFKVSNTTKTVYFVRLK